MASSGRSFLDIPTTKVLWTAFFAIVVFGDCFIQGALISILFAILKAMIDKPDWRQIFWTFSNKP